MADNKESRTERPTPRRLQKAREKGQIARSKEVPSALVLAGGLLFLAFAGQRLLQGLEGQLQSFLRMKVPADFTFSYVERLTYAAVSRMMLLTGPLLLVAVALGVGANLIQGGWTFSWHQLGLRFEKLSPKSGLSKIFSKQGIVEVLKSLALLAVIAVVSYREVSQSLGIYPRLVMGDAGQLLYWTATVSYRIGIRVAAMMLLVAAADYAFQKYRFLEQLKMTKQEVKDEFKELEGDPLTRARIRRIQRETARKRMMAEVPKADVVITNPTHYAVALSYKMESMDAPKVVAKGVGFLAIKIRELALEHDVPLVENPVLARTLYKTVELGASIPVHLYQAVAEILAYIYKIRNRWPAGMRPRSG